MINELLRGSIISGLTPNIKEATHLSDIANHVGLDEATVGAELKGMQSDGIVEYIIGLGYILVATEMEDTQQ